jgi:SAM-dependent methyltransferase
VTRAGVGRRGFVVAEALGVTDLRISVERSGHWRGHKVVVRKRRHQAKGEPADFTRPIRCILPSGSFLASTGAIALSDGSIDRIDCLDVFEFVRDDDGLAKEIARIMAPGGTLRARVPSTGPLAGFDSLNLQRYLVDISRRGARPHEIAELGWRRHYRPDELRAMFESEGLDIVSTERRGLAFGELLTFAAMFLFRWLRPNRARSRSAKRFIGYVDRVERRIPTPIGFTIELVLRRPS